MNSAKDIHVAPIDAKSANACVKRLHYSGTYARNSQLHLGVFIGGMLEGVMQFGPSLDKRKMLPLVAGTQWNGFLELNRMAFSEKLPRNSESRAIGVALRLIRKHYPHVEWVVSFADGTQCGDGTIYRASGFVLTGINKNKTIWASPDGQVGTDLAQKYRAPIVARQSVEANRTSAARRQEVFQQKISRQTATMSNSLDKRADKINKVSATKGENVSFDGASSMKQYQAMGWRPLPGYQLRYVYFLNPDARERLSVPILPFSKIDEVGAGMYKGETRVKYAMAGFPPAQRRGSADPPAPKKSGPGKGPQARRKPRRVRQSAERRPPSPV